MMGLIETPRQLFSHHDYQVSSITVNVCGSLYREWSQKKRRYSKSPADGLTVSIDYADTLGSLDSSGVKITTSSPVTLCLHGAPGSHRDFRYLIEHLLSCGVRVVAPNFPTYKLTTKSKLFRHSAEEKKEYVKSFLSAINIDTIDLLVVHSSAIYPSILLWCDTHGPQIRSFVFLNPSGHRRITAMKPKFVTSLSVALYTNKLCRKLMRTFGTSVLSITGCPVRPDNMDNVILSATTMVNSQYKKLRFSLEQLKEQNVPVLLVISGNDKLVDFDISQEMVSILGASEANYFIYTANAVVERKTSNTSFPWIVLLPHGGHYSFLRYASVINNQIISFFNCAFNNNVSIPSEEHKRSDESMPASQLETSL